MDCYFDLESKALWFGAIGNTTTQKVKIRQWEDLRVKFVRGGTPELLEVSASISIRLKLTKESTTTLTSTSTFTRPSTSAGPYTGTLSINTTQITTDLFDVDGADDEAEVLVEMEWAPAATPTQVRKSDDASIILVRSVATGSESAATDATASTALRTLPDITALTGGTSTCLDSIVTLNVTVGQFVLLQISDEPQLWQLRSGTTAENASGGIVRPDDYASTTNEKIWFRLM